MYSLFRDYLRVGPSRRLKDFSKSTGYSRTQILRVANKWRWVHRADEHDAFRERMQAEATERELRQSVEAIAKMESATVKDLVRVGRAMAKRLKHRMREDMREDPKLTFHPETVAKYAEMTIKLERLMRGEVTERTDSTLREARQKLSDRLEQISRMLDAPKGREP